MVSRGRARRKELGISVPGSASDLGIRIEAACRRIGTRIEAARAGGISDDQLARIINGKSKPSFETVAGIAKAANIDLGYFSDSGDAIALVEAKSSHGHGLRSPATTYVPPIPRGRDGTVQVPIYDARASAGPGAFVDQDLVTGHMQLDSAWMREVAGANAARLVMTQAIGNSMEPTIFSGDRLLVETGEGPRFHGGIYVVVFGGDIMVKRYFRGSGASFTLHSDNPAGGAIEVNGDDQTECRLIGRVRLILRVP